MTKARTKITIQLSTVIEDEEGKESIDNIHKGEFFSRGALDVLIFNEITENDEVIKNFMTIQSNKVNIKRSGAVTMNQQFLPERLTECFYEHPHGSIHMETKTESIEYQPLTKDTVGKLVVNYQVKLNGQQSRKHELVLTYKGEEKA